MALEEKVEALTQVVAGLREDLSKLPAFGATEKPAAKKTTAAKKKAPAKKAAPKPEHDKDEVAAIVRKVAEVLGKAAAREIITADGAKDLADLLGQPDQFDRAFADAEAALEEVEDSDGEDEEDDGL